MITYSIKSELKKKKKKPVINLTYLVKIQIKHRTRKRDLAISKVGHRKKKKKKTQALTEV